MIPNLQTKFWDWATRNAIRFGTVLIVIETVSRATVRGLKKKENH